MKKSGIFNYKRLENDRIYKQKSDSGDVTIEAKNSDEKSNSENAKTKDSYVEYVSFKGNLSGGKEGGDGESYERDFLWKRNKKDEAIDEKKIILYKIKTFLKKKWTEF